VKRLIGRQSTEKLHAAVGTVIPDLGLSGPDGNGTIYHYDKVKIVQGDNDEKK
jgi:hypothetical protein